MLIQIDQLCKDYSIGEMTISALKDINLQIEENEYVAIMGPSGSGKSTLMNIIGLLDSPTSGNYLFKGKDVSNMVDDELSEMRNQEIGFVFQNFNLLPRLTAQENVELPLVYSGYKSSERVEKALKALQRVGLESRVRHKSNEMSGGQRQRVAIARALVTNPGILLADEPTGALDSKTGREILSLFDELHQEGNTIILITHEQEIADYAHRTIYIKDGMIDSDKRK